MGKTTDPDLIPTCPDLSFEMPLWAMGIQHLVGIDEAGRGALAGPVAAAALILPADAAMAQILEGVRDSKQLTPAQRTACGQRLRAAAVTWSVGFASHTEIDTFGIVPATRLAVQRALDRLSVSPQHLLLDYLLLPECILPQTALVKGDCRSLSIAGASILAKTARDALLEELDEQYPGYGFATHKGYGVPSHLRALAQLGPSPIHRRSFAPLRDKG